MPEGISSTLAAEELQLLSGFFLHAAPGAGHSCSGLSFGRVKNPERRFYFDRVLQRGLVLRDSGLAQTGPLCYDGNIKGREVPFSRGADAQAEHKDRAVRVAAQKIEKEGTAL